MTAGHYYRFSFDVLFQSANVLAGIGLSVTIPSVTAFGARAQIMMAADGVAGETQGSITASDDAVTATAVLAATADYLATVEGVIVPSGTGNVQLRAASSSGLFDVTVRQGSVGRIVEVI